MLLRLRLRLRLRVRGRREVEGPFSVCIKIELSTLFWVDRTAHRLSEPPHSRPRHRWVAEPTGCQYE